MRRVRLRSSCLTGKAPKGKGMSAYKTTAHYYRVEAKVDDQAVEMDFWKAFPKAGT
jgi:hypothetical protein